MEHREGENGRRPSPTPIRFILEGSSNKPSVTNDLVGQNAPRKDLSSEALTPQQYLEKVTALYPEPDQVLYLETLNILTGISEQVAVRNTVANEEHDGSSEITTDFVVQHATDGEQTLLLSTDTANALLSSMHALKFKLETRQQRIVEHARREILEVINGGVPRKTASEKLQALALKVQLHLIETFDGKQQTQIQMKQMVEQVITPQFLDLPMRLGIPIELADNFLGKGGDPMDLKQPIPVDQFRAATTMFVFGLEPLGIPVRVGSQLRSAWIRSL